MHRNHKQSFISELFARLSAESPKFFKKLQALGISLAVLGAGLLAIPGLSVNITHLSGYFITAGSVLKLIASLPVCNPEELKTDNAPQSPLPAQLK